MNVIKNSKIYILLEKLYLILSYVVDIIFICVRLLFTGVNRAQFEAIISYTHKIK